MQHSNQPTKELDKARSALAGMRSSRSLAEFEEHWKDYLRRLERVWNKTSANFAKSPKWHGWKSKIDRLRKTDPLLSYLVNARGAEEHTANEIVRTEPGGIGIYPAEGNSLYIERMEIDNGKLVIVSPQRIKIEFLPGRTSLLAIVNRGRTYAPPTSHLGKEIDPTNVVAVAENGIEFYEKVRFQAEAFFK